MKKFKQIFISRALSPDSPFFRLEALGYKLIDQSLLAFEFNDFSLPTTYDAIFFYSQKAVTHFFSKEKYQTHLNYGVMGQKSSQVFETITGKRPDIIGDGDYARLSEELNIHWKEAIVLCPMGSNSLHSLATLDVKLKLVPLIIYQNTKIKELDLPDCDLLIFTSPLNVEAYQDKYSLIGKSCFAIGETTAKKIMSYTNMMVPFCTEPSEEALYSLVRRRLE